MTLVVSRLRVCSLPLFAQLIAFIWQIEMVKQNDRANPQESNQTATSDSQMKFRVNAQVSSRYEFSMGNTLYKTTTIGSP